MKQRMLVFFSIICLSFLFINSSQACTDFRLTAKDGTVLITRSLEFSQQMNSNLRSSSRGRDMTNTAPDGKPALTWKSKYGYLYVDGMGINFAIDGMNEQGLSFEYLLFPGEAQYQTIPAGKDNQAIPYYALGDWILGNFKTVDEVKQALTNIFVYQANIPGQGNLVFPVHAAIYDASGKGIVVEIVNGQMSIYSNIGVMTNSPTYPWQITNLRNYINLTPYAPKPIVINGISYAATGQGAGMIGLPGDISPPSRFVKTVVLATTAFPTNNANDELNLAEHIINNVDIPLGVVRVRLNGKDEGDSTQWVVFKDLTHKVFYYRTYNNMTLRYVSMDKVNFAENAPLLKMPLAGAPNLMDLTNQFVAAKTN